jgi:hypothetical protein
MAASSSPPLTLFVATRREDLPAGVHRYASVDGSVPGAALVWDHHVTGEPISLDALPATVSLAGLDGLGTTLADTDAVVGAAVLLLGGTSAVDPARLPVLRAASWWCDHLRGAPGVDDEADRLGHGLHQAISSALHAAKDDVSPAFASLVRTVHDALASGAPLPFATTPARAAHSLRARDRIRDDGPVALVDLRGLDDAPPPLAAYAEHRCAIAVTVDDHPHGGRRYTVGVNPHIAATPTDLGPALRALAHAEFAHGAPCVAPAPVAGNENWGGRATVFGSPWNYGSRLAPDEVVSIVRGALML